MAARDWRLGRRAEGQDFLRSKEGQREIFFAQQSK